MPLVKVEILKGKSDEHKKQHQSFREKVFEFQDKIEKSDEKKIIQEMLDYLREWWIGHINFSDQDYSACFNDHGLY